jgi:hypothetical protein
VSSIEKLAANNSLSNLTKSNNHAHEQGLRGYYENAQLIMVVVGRVLKSNGPSSSGSSRGTLLNSYQKGLVAVQMHGR